MKTRNGFVSNSSSSSFVVAFPKRPKTMEELARYMFGDKGFDGAVSLDYGDDYVISNLQVVKTVFSDIQKQRKASPKKIAKELEDRYHYGTSRNVSFWDEKTGTIKSAYGTWYGRDDYYGRDEELLEKLRKLQVAYGNLSQKHSEEGSKMVEYLNKKYDLVPRKYKDPDCEKYFDALKACKEKDEKYKKFEKKYWDKINEYWADSNKIRGKIAQVDAECFLKEHKNQFVGIFAYGDEDGLYFCVMEHGDIFENLPHIKINHH